MPPPEPSTDTVVRLRLDLGYDGTDFAGWAVQRDRRTVAGTVGEALEILFRGPVPIVVAGRTDAGVHATGQVAHIDVHPGALAALAPRDLPAGADAGRAGLRRRLAGLLPPDVRVRRVKPAPPGFDARFAALRRHYRYLIGTAEWGNEPLRRRDVFAVRRALDVEAMDRAARVLVGLHDFAAFCKPRDGATTVRELQRLSVEQDADLVAVGVTADAFCHSMVRSLVGALLSVGLGRSGEAAPGELLRAARRTAAVAVAPAHGLTLVGVDYPPDAELSARTLLTRAVRPTLSTASADDPGRPAGDAARS